MPKPCNCPTDASAVIGGVTTPHRVECVHGEPRRYAYLIAGYLTVGTLTDYAEVWADRVTDDVSLNLSTELRAWEATFHVAFRTQHEVGADTVTVTLSAGSGDDAERVTVTVPYEVFTRAHAQASEIHP